MPEILTGKTAIVTGAAHGVGHAIARRFARAGARVVASDMDQKALRKVVAAISESGGEITAFSCNMCESLSVPNLMASTLDAYDRVDILVNAARKFATGPALAPGDDMLMELFDVNVRAAFELSQAAARRMIAQAGGEDDDRPCAGSIVNVTSIAARRTLPDLLHYSVSCAALEQMTRSLAVALAPRGVRVNALALGSVETASLRDAMKTQDDLRDRLIGVTPLGRIGAPREAADAALFLASEQSSFITGQILAVDGGRATLDPLSTPAF